MRRKTILLTSISIILLVLVITHLNHIEKVVKREGNIYYFSSGNRAEVFMNDSISEPYLRYTKYDANNNYIEEGKYINGKFIGPYNSFDLNWELLMSLNFILFVGYLIFYLPNDYQKSKDWYRSKTRKKFAELDKKEQSEILMRNINCSKCKDNPSINITNEISVNGMEFIEGYCNICNENKKIRIK